MEPEFKGSSVGCAREVKSERSSGRDLVRRGVGGEGRGDADTVEENCWGEDGARKI